jgi:hypothetical protein
MSENPYAPPTMPSKPQSNAIPIWVYLICGWPLALVAIGGMIGGAMGGAAFGVNLAIWKSAMPLPVKIILIPIVGFTAIGLWLAIALGLNAAIRG